MDQALLEWADGFADTLNDRVGRVLPDVQPQFGAQVLPGRRPRLQVAPTNPSDADFVTRPLVLRAPGRQRQQVLNLRVTMFYCTDVTGRWPTVEESQFALGLADIPDPLFRVEYDRNLDRRTHLPAAHIQVHAHRDEATFLMVHADEGRPRSRWRKGRVPRLAELHLPVGGDRYRLCLEDVLTIAINEFGVNAKRGAWKALEEGRAEWRRLQLAAATRDAPQVAARVLTELGWTLTPPPSTGGQSERTHRLGEV